MTVGTNVTIGHQAMLHGCTIGDGSLIGIQAIVLNNATIGRDCLVAAGALVLEGKVFADRSLIVGAPARVRAQLTDADLVRCVARQRFTSSAARRSRRGSSGSAEHSRQPTSQRDDGRAKDGARRL
jgi:carbonic anhydrase/acetyltransferase-like protein (isoleucine patch superfamily)